MQNSRTITPTLNVEDIYNIIKKMLRKYQNALKDEIELVQTPMTHGEIEGHNAPY